MADRSAAQPRVAFYGDDVTGSEVAARDTVRVEPDPHRVAAAAEDLDLAHARNAGEGIAHLQLGIVAQVFQVIATLR